MDLEDSLDEVQTNEPVVLSFGDELSSVSIFKLIVEKDNVFHMPSLSVAVHSAYYIYNITFPPSFCTLWSFWRIMFMK